MTVHPFPNRNQLYGRRWRKARREFLTHHPLCCYCEQESRVTPATEVDHIKPHRGDPALFWNEDNWQPLCRSHHSSTKQAEEKGQTRTGCDINGNPLGKLRHW